MNYKNFIRKILLPQKENICKFLSEENIGSMMDNFVLGEDTLTEFPFEDLVNILKPNILLKSKNITVSSLQKDIQRFETLFILTKDVLFFLGNHFERRHHESEYFKSFKNMKIPNLYLPEDIILRLYQFSILSLRRILLKESWRERDFPNPVIFTKYKLLTKNGPNGGPSFATSMLDYFALSKDLRQDIENLGGTLIKKELTLLDRLYKDSDLTVPKVIDYLGTLGCKPLKSVIKTGNLYTRRLCKFPDKEGKQRVIAISDYFSQAVLNNLHEYLFDFLRSLDKDFTFNQDRFMNLIPFIGDNPNVNWYSIDLTAATDRFPRWFINELLEEFIGTEASQF